MNQEQGSQRKAVIDLGSLKVKVMIFDSKNLHLLFQRSQLVLLGKNISITGIVEKKTLNKLSDALEQIMQNLKEYHCTDVQIIATESLRLTKNKQDIIDRINQYFPNHTVTILDQALEGDLFFHAVSQCFPKESILTMDIGGGSIQIISGIWDNNQNRHSIKKRFLYKTGVYTLQQKYSPRDDIVSQLFDNAMQEVEDAYTDLDERHDNLVFGSTCMKDFISESGITLHHDRPFTDHPWYVTTQDIEQLLKDIRKLPPEQRSHLYPSGGYFIYGADYTLANLITAIKKTQARYIYPTNMNSSYGLIKNYEI